MKRAKLERSRPAEIINGIHLFWGKNCPFWGHLKGEPRFSTHFLKCVFDSQRNKTSFDFFPAELWLFRPY
jgi:hypothetical protein